MSPVITFLSDYGHADEFVGVVHGVLVSGCPEARILDISHGVPRHDVRAGALMLARALPFMPPGVHLAVVDPGVGGSRRAVALRCRREPWVLVGPDNGLLSLAAEAGGGVDEAVEISDSPWRPRVVSATFHGRDIFAPVAARLAAGAPLATCGAPLDPGELIRLELPAPRSRSDGALELEVLALDGFGNLMLASGGMVRAGLALGARMRVTAGGAAVTATVGRTFGDVAPGALVLYEDAGSMLALAVNGGSAAKRLGVAPGDPIVILAT